MRCVTIRASYRRATPPNALEGSVNTPHGVGEHSPGWQYGPALGKCLLVGRAGLYALQVGVQMRPGAGRLDPGIPAGSQRLPAEYRPAKRDRSPWHPTSDGSGSCDRIWRGVHADGLLSADRSPFFRIAEGTGAAPFLPDSGKLHIIVISLTANSPVWKQQMGIATRGNVPGRTWQVRMHDNQGNGFSPVRRHKPYEWFEFPTK